MSELINYRKQKDIFLESDPHSPLSEDQRMNFQGLDYFPENQDLRLVIQVKPYLDQEQVEIRTSTGDLQTYTRYGSLDFETAGQEASLTLYIGKDGHPFVPFRDGTSGKETYGAGRYLEPEPLGDGKFLVDFNLAYNPWCAYAPSYSCPLPPRENQLEVEILAGEKNFPG